LPGIALLKSFVYEGPQEPLVRRAAITLKLLDYMQNGAIVAGLCFPFVDIRKDGYRSA
jgi:hypothetical protein